MLLQASMITFKKWSAEVVEILKSCVHSGLDLPLGYVGLCLGSQNPRGPPANVVRIESIAVTVYDQFHKQNILS